MLLLGTSFIHCALVSLSTTSASCMWVGELEEEAVGVAAGDHAVEALGGKVLEFAAARRYSFVVLGTADYTSAATRSTAILVFTALGPAAAMTPLGDIVLIRKMEP